MHVRPLKLWDRAEGEKGVRCRLGNGGLLSLGHHIQKSKNLKFKSVVGHYEGGFVRAGGCCHGSLARFRTFSSPTISEFPFCTLAQASQVLGVGRGSGLTSQMVDDGPTGERKRLYKWGWMRT